MSYVPNAPDAGTSARTIREIGQPLAAASGWMKFLGVLFIIQGAATAITLVGILVAWLPIWIGVLLFKSASAVQRSQAQDSADALIESLARLRTYFVIQGVLLLIIIGFFAIMLLFYGALFAALFTGQR